MAAIYLVELIFSWVVWDSGSQSGGWDPPGGRETQSMELPGPSKKQIHFFNNWKLHIQLFIV